MVALFCFHTNNESFHCSMFSRAFGVVSILDFGHSNRYMVVYYHCFNCVLLIKYNVENIFKSLLSICISSLMRYLLKLLADLKIEASAFLLSFKSSFCILDNIHYQMCLLQTFSSSLLLVFYFSQHHFLQSRSS